MSNKTFDIYKFLEKRPLSWSALSSFDYDKEQWYQNYIMKVPVSPNPEMLFGSKFAHSCEIRKPLAPVTLLSKMEQKFEVKFGKIHMIGYADTFKHTSKRETGEYKTGVKAWDKKRVDKHGQITMYALMNYLQSRMRPDDCKFWLEWIPTKKVHRENGDYSGFDYVIAFRDDSPVPMHFDTKRTMKEVLEFGSYINAQVKEMELYVRNHA